MSDGTFAFCVSTAVIAAVVGVFIFFGWMSYEPSPFQMMRFRWRIKRWGSLEAYSTHAKAKRMERDAVRLMEDNNYVGAANALRQAHALKAQADDARASPKAGRLSESLTNIGGLSES